MKKILSSSLLLLLFAAANLTAQYDPASPTGDIAISYLPDTTVYCDTCPIASEIYNVHSRFLDDGQIEAFTLLEVEFLLSRRSIGETFSELTIYRDTLQTSVYTLPVNDIIDSSDAYPNWYKIIIQDSPVFTDYIEIRDPSGWPVFPLNAPPPSGNTLGLFEQNQQWGITIDYPVKIKIHEIISDMSEETNLLKSFQLHQNYPNPFNSETIIMYSIPECELVSMKVYDILGVEVETLVNEWKEPGSYQVAWNSSKAASGIYFLRLKAGSLTALRKMMLMK